jgi:hypothetical protein
MSAANGMLLGCSRFGPRRSHNISGLYQHGVIAGAVPYWLLNGYFHDVAKVVVPRQDGKTGSWRGARPKHRTGTTMEEYVGLDGSLKDTAISVRRNGKRVWRGKCASDPQLLAAELSRYQAASGLRRRGSTIRQPRR